MEMWGDAGRYGDAGRSVHLSTSEEEAAIGGPATCEYGAKICMESDYGRLGCIIRRMREREHQRATGEQRGAMGSKGEHGRHTHTHTHTHIHTHTHERDRAHYG